MHQQRLDQAIGRFLAALDEILTGLREDIAARVHAGDFASVQQLSRDAQRVQELRQYVQQFQQFRFEAALPEPATPAPPQDKQNKPENRRRRAARDNLTPQRAYRLPILKALEILGGRAPVRDVLREVHRLIGHRLKPDDYARLPMGNDIRWE
ncbi:MAG: hypothetical protein RMJ43_04005, partial [Chloroherpetonaceae bacterium]|nr:hypothetical protein [Chloroherpetonaceae bacterium]